MDSLYYELLETKEFAFHNETKTNFYRVTKRMQYRRNLNLYIL